MVPCAAQGWYSVFVNETKPASVLFRAYIRRKPSGLLLVTVLSTLLPRPLFRSYPLDIGEAAAVERSVGHALDLLPTVNVVAAKPLHCALPCGPEDESCHADKREEQHAAEGNGEFKQLWCGDEFEHCSQPPNFYDQIGSDKNQEAHQNESETSNAKTVEKRNEPIRHCSPHGLHQPCNNAAIRSEEQEGADGYAVKQHLRLRVVWQGLL